MTFPAARSSIFGPGDLPGYDTESRVHELARMSLIELVALYRSMPGASVDRRHISSKDQAIRLIRDLEDPETDR